MRSARWNVGLGGFVACVLAAQPAHAQSEPQSLDAVAITPEQPAGPPEFDCVPLIVEAHDGTVFGELYRDHAIVAPVSYFSGESYSHPYPERAYCVQPGRSYTLGARHREGPTREYSFVVDAPGRRLVVRPSTAGRAAGAASVYVAAALLQIVSTVVTLGGLLGLALCFRCDASGYDVAVFGGVAGFIIGSTLYGAGGQIHSGPTFDLGPLHGERRRNSPLRFAIAPTQGGAVVALGVTF